jgi:hypothetical protein
VVETPKVTKGKKKQGKGKGGVSPVDTSESLVVEAAGNGGASVEVEGKGKKRKGRGKNKAKEEELSSASAVNAFVVDGFEAAHWTDTQKQKGLMSVVSSLTWTQFEQLYAPLTQIITQHFAALTNVPLLGTSSCRRQLRARAVRRMR